MPKPRKSRAKYTSVPRAELIGQLNQALAGDHRMVRACRRGDGYVICDVRTGAVLEREISRTGLIEFAHRVGVLDPDRERVRG
jgi:hypothetical protein